MTTFVGGLAAMTAIRDSLELAITEAENAPAGQKGHVYLTDWRFNCLRDLSTTANPWGIHEWDDYLSGHQAVKDQTALGLLLRLMRAGVAVRLMIWYPPAISSPDVTAGLAAHISDHRYAARVIAKESASLTPAGGSPLGIVALDMRTADSTTASSHHQKTVVIRGASTSVAYVGGVDLAFTRRDAPALGGDWESGAGIPDPALGWPRAPDVNYTSVDAVERFTDVQGSDLPANVYGDGSDVLTRQVWHDQHLRLEGPIVGTLEWQFKERWEDSTDGRLFDIDGRYAKQNWRIAQVIFSTPDAFNGNVIKPLLPFPASPQPVGSASTRVQMWRTIPWRTTRIGPPFRRAEFTVMAGIANAVKQAKELIWIFDQYFWSRPLARLLNAQLRDATRPRLHVIVVLPPHADSQFPVAHRARALALDALTAGLTKTGSEFDRVAVYNLWVDSGAATTSPLNRGMYVHAKAHTYDGDLLVCGSANLNRRSFLCDSEIACAVLDPAVVLSHQAQLWSYLFHGAQRPSVDLSVSGSGKQLFDDFRNAVRTGPSILIPDPWQDAIPTLPNGEERDQSPLVAFEARYGSLLDPSSISNDVEEPIFDAALAGKRVPRLDEIVSRLERQHVGDDWTYRHP